jgi:hypothetical protein
MLLFSSFRENFGEDTDARYMRDVGPLLDGARHADPEHAGGLAGAVAHAYYLLNSHGDVDAAHQMLVRATNALEDP